MVMKVDIIFFLMLRGKQTLFFKNFFIFVLCIYHMFIYIHTHRPGALWRPEDNLSKSVSSSTMCVPGAELRSAMTVESTPTCRGSSWAQAPLH